MIAQAFGHTPQRLGDPVTLRRRGLGVYFESGRRMVAMNQFRQRKRRSRRRRDQWCQPLVPTSRRMNRGRHDNDANAADVDLGFAAGSGEQTHAVGIEL